MRTVEFYRTRSGRSPVEDFLHEVPAKATTKILRVLDKVMASHSVPARCLKKLRGTEDMWEIRVQQGGNAYRLLSFFDGPHLLVVVTGFAKKTQRIPMLEIELAHQRRRDYLSNKGRG